ncbi:MAG: toprim domain-containing protein [Rhizobiaceae bacterium]
MTDARQLTMVLGGRWCGNYGVAPCPVCQPDRKRTQNALTLAEGRVGLLAHCKKSDCKFTDILWATGLSHREHITLEATKTSAREAERHIQLVRREASARNIWNETCPIGSTVAEKYLRDARRITSDLPTTLRFHQRLIHGHTKSFHPALVALVEGGKGFAIHRTWLKPDGSGKASIEPSKAMLGSTSGGAVRLAEGGSRLVVGEGLESTLSLSCGLLESPATLWAGLSTSGIRGLSLPEPPGKLTIAADGDQPGREAAYALAERAQALGWAVGILDPGTGFDFNDILVGKAFVP